MSVSLHLSLPDSVSQSRHQPHQLLHVQSVVGELWTRVTRRWTVALYTHMTVTSALSSSTYVTIYHSLLQLRGNWENGQGHVGG